MSVGSIVLLSLLGGGAALALLIAYGREGKPLRRLLSTALQGLCALAAVNVAGVFTGVTLGLGWLTGGVAMLLGLPGVAGLLLMRLLFL
ncbi:MAG: pro-sigmaK processing inhibitor BofA family protein [Clostridia bacterium]|nr:pro-sigmaK processing inhibitor BofA family protein [Clostridia bacterium]